MPDNVKKITDELLSRKGACAPGREDFFTAVGLPQDGNGGFELTEENVKRVAQHDDVDVYWAVSRLLTRDQRAKWNEVTRQSEVHRQVSEVNDSFSSQFNDVEKNYYSEWDAYKQKKREALAESEKEFALAREKYNRDRNAVLAKFRPEEEKIQYEYEITSAKIRDEREKATKPFREKVKEFEALTFARLYNEQQEVDETNDPDYCPACDTVH